VPLSRAIVASVPLSFRGEASAAESDGASRLATAASFKGAPGAGLLPPHDAMTETAHANTTTERRSVSTGRPANECRRRRGSLERSGSCHLARIMVLVPVPVRDAERAYRGRLPAASMASVLSIRFFHQGPRENSASNGGKRTTFTSRAAAMSVGRRSIDS
jgi:hypothetical protein